MQKQVVISQCPPPRKSVANIVKSADQIDDLQNTENIVPSSVTKTA